MDDREMEKYLIAQEVILYIHYYIHNLYNMDIDYEEAMENIQLQLKRLEILIPQPKEPEQPEEEMFLLTKTNFGPAAYLKHSEDGYVVILEDNTQLTETYSNVTQALDSYIDSCKHDPYVGDEFIQDFMVGIENGACEFGDNDYALYVEKCFNSYVFGKEL